MTIQSFAPRDIQTTINYYDPKNDETPYIHVQEPPAGFPKTNVRVTAYPTVVHDARGKEDTVGLNVSGFAWVRYLSVEKEFVDEEQIRTVYYTEVEELLKMFVSGARRVFIFDHTIRRPVGTQTKVGNAPAREPLHRAHVDQSFKAAEQRVWKHLPEDAERMLKGRYQIINVRRPIANTVAHEPLGVADYRERFSVKYSPRPRWYYLSDQTPDEVTLIKCFDSDTDKARLTPHSAFPDKTSPADALRRQSAEVTALVFDRDPCAGGVISHP